MIPKKPVLKTPVACIARLRDEAYCGREIYSDEFAFQDPGYAVKHYENSKLIQACPNCVAYVKERVLEKLDLSAFATRGLEKHK